MGSFDFYTTGDALIFTHVQPPHYAVKAAPAKNVVYGTTVGGKVKSQVRGADRKHFILNFRYVSTTQLASFLSWHATYGAMRAAFKIELPAGLTELAGGTKLAVRNVDGELDYEADVRDLYHVMVELIEDLG